MPACLNLITSHRFQSLPHLLRKPTNTQRLGKLNKLPFITAKLKNGNQLVSANKIEFLNIIITVQSPRITLGIIFGSIKTANRFLNAVSFSFSSQFHPIPNLPSCPLESMLPGQAANKDFFMDRTLSVDNVQHHIQ